MSCLRVFEPLETIFIHLPKTGGSTIREYLAQVAGAEKKFWGKIPAEFEHFDRFTIVRNPFNRLVSSWLYCRKMGWVERCSICDFLPWVLDNDLPVLPPFGSEETAKIRLCKHHTAPQTHEDFLLTEANQVFKFENFSQAILTLSERFGFQPRGLHLNRTERKPLTEYFDERLIGMVREYFAEDFAALGYGLNLPNR